MQLFRVTTPDGECYDYIYTHTLSESYINRIRRIIDHINYNPRYKSEYEASIWRKIYRETSIKLQKIEPYTAEMIPTEEFNLKKEKLRNRKTRICK